MSEAPVNALLRALVFEDVEMGAHEAGVSVEVMAGLMAEAKALIAAKDTGVFLTREQAAEVLRLADAIADRWVEVQRLMEPPGCNDEEFNAVNEPYRAARAKLVALLGLAEKTR